MPCVTREVKTPFHTVESNSYQLIFKIPNEKEYFPVTAVAVDLSYENHKITYTVIGCLFFIGKGRSSEDIRFAETIRIGPGIDE